MILLSLWSHAGGASSTSACDAHLTFSAGVRERLRGPEQTSAPRDVRDLEPIASARPAVEIERELRRHARVLVDTHPGDPGKGFAVFEAQGFEIPLALIEIGRAREETFRLAGEGSGRAVDVDQYDSRYVQLVCWDKTDRVISGGYRLGKADDILRARGVDGLYLNEFFAFDQRVLRRFSARALEVGRSFVRPDYQKGLTLSILWYGIGRYLVENPRYRYLIGPVSISGRFSDTSLALISRYLSQRHGHPRGRHARPRTPVEFRTRLTPDDVDGIVARLDSLHHLRDVVRLVEDDPTLKLPTLIKAYLDLDAKFMGFNWDHGFNTLDGLIWTDLSRLPFAIHKKYMGEDSARAYRAANGL